MDDERQVELDCISAIFPEIVLDPSEPFTATIDLPVNPQIPVKVYFPASADIAAQLPTPPRSATSGQEDGLGPVDAVQNVESHDLSYLPSLQLHIVLPEGYPASCAPQFKVSTTPEWLIRDLVEELQANGDRLWEESDHSEIVFGYIDSLQQAAENAFGYGEGKVLEIPQEYKIALLDYDTNARQAAFEKETFDCGVCLDPKKGTVCHKMVACGHVFCVQCLQDFYNNAISEGDLVSVRCLAPDCAKKRAEAQSAKKRKSKTQLSPSELLQIPLIHEMVTRYVKLKHKAELESDKNTIYCPRKWCQGAARSKKHKKPEGFEVADSDDESDSEEQGKNEKFVAEIDLLSVCEDCSFAFCRRCYQGWHGEFKSCAPKRDDGELTEEERASMEYMKLHTTPCPTCAAPAQKTHGCNHMICFKCNSHFCYLCSAWLEPGNPYKHYNTVTTSCFQRLWELEAGDGDDVGRGYGGGIQRPENVALETPDEDLAEEEVAQILGQPLQEAGPELERDEPEVPGEEAPAVPHQELEREGPLVLRINQPARPRAPAIPAVPDAPQARRNGHPRRGHPNQRVIDPRPAGLRAAAPMGGHRMRPGQGRRQDPRGAEGLNEAQAEAHAQAQEEAQHRWVQMFVEAALNDEEDELDSDGDEDDALWEIPVR